MTINILIIGTLCAVALLIVPRFLGRSKERMLSQYNVLEKRFRLKRHTFTSKWGSGIGERHSLSGDYRGYPIAIYDHFHGKGRSRRAWTSLTLEATFAGEREFVIESLATVDGARFSSGNEAKMKYGDTGAFTIIGLDEDKDTAFADRLASDCLADFNSPGAFRLSKGFFEYRELGLLMDEATRLRFQEALLILADMADGVSEYVGSLDA